MFPSEIRVAAREPELGVLERITAPAGSAIPLARVLVVLAHPDDEVLAFGARLERLSGSRLLTITDGAPEDGGDAHHHGFATLDEYREARRQELACALAHAGLPEEVAPLFAARVPDQKASFSLRELARAIAAEIDAFRPEAVVTHPYEGGHPDHDACAFAVHAAVRLCSGSQNGEPAPVIVEAPFYHAGEGGTMCTGRFLPGDPSGPIVVFELGEVEQSNKRARLACFGSQAETLAQFGTSVERFRIAPWYDFLSRPHAGQLFYEQFGWGMDGDRFCELAREAMTDLFGVAGVEMNERRSGLICPA